MNIDIEKRRSVYLISKKIQALLDVIVTTDGCDEWEAISGFYHSELYLLLSDEETKVWWFSTPALYEVYLSEKKNGTLRGAPYIDDLVA